MAARRCTERRATAICRPSARSSTPAHRCTSRPTATASPAGGIPAWAVGSARPNRRGSARASAAGARRTTPLHCAAYSGDAGATAALLGAGADASIKESSGYAAPSRAVPLWPHGRPPPAARIDPAVLVGGRRSDGHSATGRAARTRRRWSRRAKGCAALHRLPHAGRGAACAHILSLPFVRTRQRRRMPPTCTVGSLRPCTRFHPGLPLLPAPPRCAPQCFDAAPARTARAVPWSLARKVRMRCECTFPAHSADRTSHAGVAGQTSPGGEFRGARSCPIAV
jgi:hypothetical protein